MQQVTHKLMVYDIADPNRLQRVQRCCSQHALAMQNSVYLFQGTMSQWRLCEQALQRLLHLDQDALWVFELDHSHTCQQLGKTVLPAGLLIAGGTCFSELIT